MDNSNYLPRIIDARVDEHLQAFGAVSIEGPKWCGKTWTASYHAASEISIADPTGGFQNRNLAKLNPLLILEGKTPRLIDEWQEEPSLWDAVRIACDKSGAKGNFILAGSATPQIKGVFHSGAGRIARLRMRTMTLYEAQRSLGAISLQDICQGKAPDMTFDNVELSSIVDWVVRGGWPENIGVPLNAAALLPEQYISALLSSDVYRIDSKRRDVQKMRLLLRSLARNESTCVSNRTLRRDINETDHESVDIDTVADYLNIFERFFLIDNQKPYASALRSSTRIKQQEKRHLCDPSLAVALMGATPEMLTSDLKTLGFLFEALVEHDLRIYAESFAASLYHYQDYHEKEIDAVVELPNGDWCAIEVKLGANEIEEAAANLLAIKASFEEDVAAKPPSALCVVCGMSNAAYMRADGVYVVPLHALKP